MMLLEKYQVINQCLQNKEKSDKVILFLGRIRKSDIITSTLLANKADIDLEDAKRVLIFLVDKKIMEFFIVVECINPELIYENSIHHYKHFDSLKEFNEFSKNKECNICECGYEYDFNHAKIGFRLAKGV